MLITALRKITYFILLITIVWLSNTCYSKDLNKNTCHITWNPSFNFQHSPTPYKAILHWQGVPQIGAGCHIHRISYKLQSDNKHVHISYNATDNTSTTIPFTIHQSKQPQTSCAVNLTLTATAILSNQQNITLPVQHIPFFIQGSKHQLERKIMRRFVSPSCVQALEKTSSNSLKKTIVPC